MNDVNGDYIVQQIREFAECNPKCSERFYYGEGCKACAFGKIIEIIKNAPEAEPVVHGEWVAVHEHIWLKDKYGEIDEFAWNEDIHNGPICEVCHASPCIFCKPDWKESSCHVESYKCSICGNHVKSKTVYCSDCGAKMKGEEG